MNAVTLLCCLDDYLRPLVDAEERGVLSIAADPEEALEMLAGNAPQRWRVALVFAGYSPIQQDDGDDSYAEAMLKLYVQLPGSAANAPTNELHRLQGNGTRPMMERIEKVGLWMRRLRLNLDGVDCRQCRFHGSEWEPETRSGKALHRTHRLDFRVAVALDVAEQEIVWPSA